MPGAKPGERRGGRKAGTPNKASAAKVAEVEASGLTPLDYMLNVMRDDAKPADVRLDAAKSAAPYVHPKLASVEHKGDKNNPVALMFTWLPPQSLESCSSPSINAKSASPRSSPIAASARRWGRSTTRSRKPLRTRGLIRPLDTPTLRQPSGRPRTWRGAISSTTPPRYQGSIEATASCGSNSRTTRRG